MRITERRFDVVVCGGGLSGVLAAVAAAREGAATLLIERYAALGGMATLGLVQPITTWGLGHAYVIGGTGRALLERMIGREPESATPLTTYGPTCDTEYLKRELEEVLQVHGVTLLYHTWITGVERTGERIEAVRAISKAGERSLAGQVFVDATGDGDVAVAAGTDFVAGSQGITLMFLLSGVDRERCPPHDEMLGIYRRHGPVNYRGVCLFWARRPDSVYVNMTEVEGLDGCDPEHLTRATVECRAQAWRILELFRRHVPGFEHAYIAQTAPALGVRESRHVRGLYTLTGDDVLAGRDFADTIARAACPVDIHGSANGGRGEYRALRRSYGVPYRCLVTPGSANLLLTGRCLSADSVAHSSVRRMAPGLALGEAAGLAAAKALGHDARAMDVPPLQQALRGYGAILE